MSKNILSIIGFIALLVLILIFLFIQQKKYSDRNTEPKTSLQTEIQPLTNTQNQKAQSLSEIKIGDYIGSFKVANILTHINKEGAEFAQKNPLYVEYYDEYILEGDYDITVTLEANLGINDVDGSIFFDSFVFKPEPVFGDINEIIELQTKPKYVKTAGGDDVPASHIYTIPVHEVEKFLPLTNDQLNPKTNEDPMVLSVDMKISGLVLDVFPRRYYIRPKIVSMSQSNIQKPTNTKQITSELNTTKQETSDINELSLVNDGKINKTAIITPTTNLSCSHTNTSQITREDFLDNFILSLVDWAGRSGHQGLFPIQGDPIIGVNVIAEARIGYPVSNFLLEVTDQKTNKVLQTLPLTNPPGAMDSDYYVDITVPEVPFNIFVCGKDDKGDTFYVEGGRFLPKTAMIRFEDAPGLNENITKQIPLKVKNFGTKRTFRINVSNPDNHLLIVTNTEPFVLNQDEEKTIMVSVTADSEAMKLYFTNLIGRLIDVDTGLDVNTATIRLSLDTYYGE